MNDSTEFWTIANPAIDAGLIARNAAYRLATQHKPGRSADSRWATKIRILKEQIADKHIGAGLPDWRNQARPHGITTFPGWCLFTNMRKGGPAALYDRQAQRAILSVKYGLQTGLEELELLGLLEIVERDRYGIKSVRLTELAHG